MLHGLMSLLSPAHFAAAICRRLYNRPDIGIGRFQTFFGGRASRGARPEIRQKASGARARPRQQGADVSSGGSRSGGTSTSSRMWTASGGAAEGGVQGAGKAKVMVLQGRV